MRRNRGRTKKIGVPEILILLIFLVGLSALAYPTVSDLWNKYRNYQLITAYDRSVAGLSDEDYKGMMEEAKEYNRRHTVNTVVDAFDGKIEEKNQYTSANSYDDYLNPRGDGVMGYIYIPKIHVELAVYHGTGADALQQGAGHMEGTSLPVGGAGTHAVIAGHRGLPTARLFTDLDQLEEDDLFYMHVLGETLAYKVDRIVTVKPEETDALVIEDGKDYMTLLTCTPYGVNTHRLLVRGVRTAYDPRQDNTEGFLKIAFGDKRVFLLLLGLAVFTVILTVMFKGKGSRNKQEGDRINEKKN